MTKALDIKGDVSTGEHDIHEHSFDWGSLKIEPDMIVYPRDTDDIKRVIGYVNDNRGDDPSLSITARSAGTDVTGGPLNESIILDFMRYFSNMRIEDGYAYTQPGVYFRDFDDKTMEQNLFLPSAPESKDLCALGGMVANNSGGKKTYRYGKTIDYVEEVKVVLQDGNEYIFGQLSMEELEGKKSQDDFEGEVYRRMHGLLTEFYDDIKAAQPRVTKNSTGYPLWRVWDKEKGTFDLSKVFVGSQGTLGVITEAKIRLIAPKSHSQITSIFVPDPDKLTQVISRLKEVDLETIELYDRNAILFLTQHMPKLLKTLGKEAIPIGLRFLPDLSKFVKEYPEFIITAEVAEDSEELVNEKLKRVSEVLDDLGLESHTASSEKESDKYRVMRKSSFPVLHGLSDKEPLTFVDDVVVKTDDLKDYVPKLREILDSFDFEYAIIGHIGDGNLHIITLMDLERPDIADINDELARRVNQLTADFNGSISAEHNDGLTRGPFLGMMYGESIVTCFERTKDIFDPDGIFNPNTKVRVDWDYTLSHIRKERPHKL